MQPVFDGLHCIPDGMRDLFGQFIFYQYLIPTGYPLTITVLQSFYSQLPSPQQQHSYNKLLLAPGL